MKRILIGCCGGSPSINFARSLRDAKDKYYLIGMDCEKYNIFRSEVDESHLITLASDPSYLSLLQDLIEETKPDMMHTQNDFSELKVISDSRNKLDVTLFIPSMETINTCIDKNLSYKAWKKTGFKVPDTEILNKEEDLKKFIEKYGKVWIRKKIGGFGLGSLPTDNFEFARAWIDYYKGWGDFTASEYLSPESVTWMSIWKDGNLVVAQGRKRLYWEFSNRTISGVTGITGTGQTVSDPIVDKMAQDSIYSIDKNPNGIFSVDFTYDKEGTPCPTEINIGRFFTTHYFFTKAGLNMPEIYLKLAFDEKLPEIKKKINPLPEGLLWVRGMDVLPVLTSTKEVQLKVENLNSRKEKVRNIKKI